MNEATKVIENHKALLVEKYTELLNQWNAAMTAGDFTKGNVLMTEIKSYMTALGI